MNEEEEMVYLDIGFAGAILEPKSDKIVLIDADTIAFIGCLGAEEVNMVLPREFYVDEEWEEIEANPTYSEDDGEYYTSNFSGALERCEEKIAKILDLTGCQEVELHFSSGKSNFRFDLYPEYKANRTVRAPLGLREVKLALLDKYAGDIHTRWEADDIVVCKKRENPEKYLLAAIDKDVIYALPGRHFNYFEANYARGDTLVIVDMQFVEVTEKLAKYWPYMQIINGDTSDNIIGPKRIGPQTMIPYFGGTKPKPAVKKLQDVIDYVPDDLTQRELWAICVAAYEDKNLTEFDAVLNMNLVNMNMLTSASTQDKKVYTSHNGYSILEWRPNE